MHTQLYMRHMHEWKINTVNQWINIKIIIAILKIYILNQKCVVLIIEKSKRRDV